MKENIEKINMIKTAYIPLVSHFVNNQISAWAFAQHYFDTMRDDPSVSSDSETFKVLQAIFEDCDAYWPDPDPSEEGYEIDEEQLRRCCSKNLEKLKKIVETNG